MLPSDAMNNSENSNAAYAVNGSELSRCVFPARVKVANCPHLVRRKLCVAMSFAMRELQLLRGISNIIRVRAQEQMCWVYACGIVASGTVVQHTQALGNWATQQFPSGSMRHSLATFLNLTPIASLFRANPQPAAACFFDVPPKLLGVGLKARPSTIFRRGQIARNLAIKLSLAREASHFVTLTQRLYSVYA